MQNTGPVGIGKDVNNPIGSDIFIPKMEPITFNPQPAKLVKLEELLANLIEQLKEKDARIVTLTDILLKQAGLLDTKVIVPDNLSTKEQVINKHKSWDDVKRNLEKRYAVTKQELEKASKALEESNEDLGA